MCLVKCGAGKKGGVGIGGGGMGSKQQGIIGGSASKGFFGLDTVTRWRTPPAQCVNCSNDGPNDGSNDGSNERDRQVLGSVQQVFVPGFVHAAKWAPRFLLTTLAVPSTANQ